MIPAAFPPLGIEFFCSEFGEGINPIEMIFYRLIGKVVNRATEFLDFPLYHQSLVDILSFPAGLVLSKETDLTIRIPSGVTYPSAKLKDLSGHGKARTLWLIFLEFDDFLLEFERKPLVGIQRENPGERCLTVAEILLIREVCPLSLEDLLGVLFGYFNCLVPTVGIDDYDF